MNPPPPLSHPAGNHHCCGHWHHPGRGDGGKRCRPRLRVVPPPGCGRTRNLDPPICHADRRTLQASPEISGRIRPISPICSAGLLGF